MKRIIYNFKYEDNEFGTVFVNQKKSARRAIMSIVNGKLFVVVPVTADERIVRQTIDACRADIRNLFQQSQMKKTRLHTINENFVIETGNFNFSIVCNRKYDFQIRYEPLFYDRQHEGQLIKRGLMQDLHKYSIILECPEDLNFDDDKKQEWLESVIVRTIQKFAEPYLSWQLFDMSRKSGLPIELQSIGHAQTRWGSCRIDKNVKKGTMSREHAVVNVGPFTPEEYMPHKISLSAYTALLPEHLTKFIILHELSHTRHPDHSADFHATVNLLTQAILGLTEDECEKQMKTYTTNIFAFASKNHSTR